NKEDMVRQLVAYALGQIAVISWLSDLQGHGSALGIFYDILLDMDQGHYDVLLQVLLLSRAMGYYNNNYKNPRKNPEENIHPDENYAREVMQLYSIGLYVLNDDGTHKKDSAGKDIPTYDNMDIQKMARVFTGLGPGGLSDTTQWWLTEPYFG